MGDPLGEFLAAPPLFPEEELELTPAEGERLNSVLMGEAPQDSPTEPPSPTEDDGPPDYGHDDDGPPEHALSGDESERDGGASGSASAGADNNSTGKGKKGYGKFGKSKWDNHPTQVPYRKGKDGGKRGPPKRSGGANATWYRKFYSLKNILPTDKLREWLEMNPHPSHGKGYMM